MIFRLMALVMGGVVLTFATSVDSEHAGYAALIPAAAAFGMWLLGTT